MKVGRTFKHRGQQYECLDRFEYERPATWIWIYTLRSACPECGRRFTCTASKSQRDKNQLPRRCEHCRDPGRPVVMPPVTNRSQAPTGQDGKTSAIDRAGCWFESDRAAHGRPTEHECGPATASGPIVRNRIERWRHPFSHHSAEIRWLCLCRGVTGLKHGGTEPSGLKHVEKVRCAAPAAARNASPTRLAFRADVICAL